MTTPILGFFTGAGDANGGGSRHKVDDALEALLGDPSDDEDQLWLEAKALASAAAAPQGEPGPGQGQGGGTAVVTHAVSLISDWEARARSRPSSVDLSSEPRQEVAQGVNEWGDHVRKAKQEIFKLVESANAGDQVDISHGKMWRRHRSEPRRPADSQARPGKAGTNGTNHGSGGDGLQRHTTMPAFSMHRPEAAGGSPNPMLVRAITQDSQRRPGPLDSDTSAGFDRDRSESDSSALSVRVRVGSHDVDADAGDPVATSAGHGNGGSTDAAGEAGRSEDHGFIASARTRAATANTETAAEAAAAAVAAANAVAVGDLEDTGLIPPPPPITAPLEDAIKGTSLAAKRYQQLLDSGLGGGSGGSAPSEYEDDSSPPRSDSSDGNGDKPVVPSVPRKQGGSGAASGGRVRLVNIKRQDMDAIRKKRHKDSVVVLEPKVVAMLATLEPMAEEPATDRDDVEDRNAAPSNVTDAADAADPADPADFGGAPTRKTSRSGTFGVETEVVVTETPVFSAVDENESGADVEVAQASEPAMVPAGRAGTFGRAKLAAAYAAARSSPDFNSFSTKGDDKAADDGASEAEDKTGDASPGVTRTARIGTFGRSVTPTRTGGDNDGDRSKDPTNTDDGKGKAIKGNVKRPSFYMPVATGRDDGDDGDDGDDDDDLGAGSSDPDDRFGDFYDPPLAVAASVEPAAISAVGDGEAPLGKASGSGGEESGSGEIDLSYEIGVPGGSGSGSSSSDGALDGLLWATEGFDNDWDASDGSALTSSGPGAPSSATTSGTPNKARSVTVSASLGGEEHCPPADPEAETDGDGGLTRTSSRAGSETVKQRATTQPSVGPSGRLPYAAALPPHLRGTGMGAGMKKRTSDMSNVSSRNSAMSFRDMHSSISVATPPSATDINIVQERRGTEEEVSALMATLRIGGEVVVSPDIVTDIGDVGDPDDDTDDDDDDDGDDERTYRDSLVFVAAEGKPGTGKTGPHKAVGRPVARFPAIESLRRDTENKHNSSNSRSTQVLSTNLTWDTRSGSSDEGGAGVGDDDDDDRSDGGVRRNGVRRSTAGTIVVETASYSAEDSDDDELIGTGGGVWDSVMRPGRFNHSFFERIPVPVPEDGFVIAPLLLTALAWIQEHGMVPNIFKAHASAAEVTALLAQLDWDDPSSVDFDEGFTNPHLVATLVKTYFHELPEPVIAASLCDDFVKAATIGDTDACILALRVMLGLVAPAKYELLRRLTRLLHAIASSHYQTHMRIGSLAEVLGPTLFRGMSYNDAIALLNVLTAFCDSVFLPKGQLRPRTIERLRLRVRRYSSMAASVAASDTELPPYLDDDGNVQWSGWMTKQGGSIKTWRRRWFFLEDGTLTYYKSPSKFDAGKAPLGVISLEHCRVLEAEGKTQRAGCIEIATPRRKFFMVPEETDDTKTWVAALEYARPRSSFPEKQGFLTKRGRLRKSWKSRWFVLMGTNLYYCKTASDSIPKGILPLHNCTVARAEEEIGRPCCFKITTMYGRVLYLVASSNRAVKEWMAAIEATVDCIEDFRHRRRTRTEASFYGGAGFDSGGTGANGAGEGSRDKLRASSFQSFTGENAEPALGNPIGHTSLGWNAHGAGPAENSSPSVATSSAYTTFEAPPPLPLRETPVGPGGGTASLGSVGMASFQHALNSISLMDDLDGFDGVDNHDFYATSDDGFESFNGGGGRDDDADSVFPPSPSAGNGADNGWGGRY